MARFRPPDPLSNAPTAHTLPAEVDVTPFSRLESPGLGLGALTHFRPFQCRIRVVVADPARRSPTAQAFPAEMAATPARVGVEAGLGLARRFQARPFQRKVMVC